MYWCMLLVLLNVLSCATLFLYVAFCSFFFYVKVFAVENIERMFLRIEKKEKRLQFFGLGNKSLKK